VVVVVLVETRHQKTTPAQLQRQLSRLLLQHVMQLIHVMAMMLLLLLLRHVHVLPSHPLLLVLQVRFTEITAIHHRSRPHHQQQQGGGVGITCHVTGACHVRTVSTVFTGRQAAAQLLVAMTTAVVDLQITHSHTSTRLTYEISFYAGLLIVYLSVCLSVWRFAVQQQSTAPQSGHALLTQARLMCS